MDEELRRLERQAAIGDEEAKRRLERYKVFLTHKPGCEMLRYWDEFEEAKINFEREILAYKAKWPNYCEECGGWGGHVSYYDPSPSGIGLSPGYMMDYDPCAECLEQDICPRCGFKTPDIFVEGEYEDYYQCPKCGWKEGDEGIPQEPPWPPECTCWEEDLEALGW